MLQKIRIQLFLILVHDQLAEPEGVDSWRMAAVDRAWWWIQDLCRVDHSIFAAFAYLKEQRSFLKDYRSNS
jgi:hypothetical protein